MKKQMPEDFIEKSLFAEIMQTAAIDLFPDESEILCEELNCQMEIIRQLEAIPLDENISPVVHGNPYPFDIRCGLRQDEWVPFADPNSIISQAPFSKDDFIVSPDVPHQRIG